MKAVKQLNARTRRGIDKAFRKERVLLKRETVEGSKEKKTGRIYTVYRGRGGRKLKRPRQHQASATNESPAILTGALNKSLGFKMQRGKILTYGANTPYARRWELSRRTYLLRSIKKRRMDIWNSLESHIKQEIGK